jgi:hypothetical protein
MRTPVDITMPIGSLLLICEAGFFIAIPMSTGLQPLG